ncbi:MAG: NAD(P)H-dependent oxidoreductase subunit E [Chromatiales bacterium]|nr:NAD(P)H-dependent oxidoreductase subunit E [Chromatiales bacterium]
MTETTIKLKQSKRRKRKRGEAKGRCASSASLSAIRALLGNRPRRRDLLLEYLHLIQDRYGHIAADHCVALAEEMKISTSEVYEVATFYHHFDLVDDNQTPPPPLTVRVCDSITCEMAGCEALIKTLQQKINPNEVRIQRVPCVGRCEQAPIAVVGTNPIEKATVDNISNAIQLKASVCPATSTHLSYAAYCKRGGYQLLKALHNGERDTESVIKALEDSGLRGLGGAGFPAGRKWRIVKDQPAPRYLAVNIDEGEPGTFKDRYYLERDPHRFFEGMLIAAFVVELDAIYIYLRDEYAGLRKMLAQELELLQKQCNLPLPAIELRRAAGAYICGEESAMIESIEGKRGMPRLRPPFIAQVGLFGRPTLEHNMETLYWVRDIVEKGSEWFSSEGRNGRQGLRSFSVSGRVNKPGVHLTPAGITVQELIDEYCDGMQAGHTFYGYFPGGASGGILPASMGDIPLDFDTLNEYGCFIGSAAIIILSDKDRARNAALNAMRFFSHESCGKCTPCRVGTSKAVRLMEKEQWDIPLMNELSQVMADASICGLGQAAPNPLQCVIKYFPSELENND